MAGSWTGNVYYGDDTKENVAGTEADESIYGAGGNDTLSGGDGNDHLLGQAGSDVLNGGAGADFLYGGERVNGGDGSDYILVELGAVRLNGDADGDRFYFGDGAVDMNADTLAGGTGTDTMQLEFADGSFNITSTGIALDGKQIASISGFEIFDIQIYGSDSQSVVIAGGSAQVYTGSGNDFVSTGNGNDEIGAGHGHDTVDTGNGDDDVTLGAGGKDKVTLGDGFDSLQLSEWVVGSRLPGLGTYDGGSGDDIFHLSFYSVEKGFSFNDGVLKVGNLVVAKVTSFETYSLTVQGEANYSLAGGSGDDGISGHKGDQIFSGGGGDDNLNAGSGSDQLSGDAGDDVLAATLDGSADTFSGGADTDSLSLTTSSSVAFTGGLTLSGNIATSATLKNDGKIIGKISGIESLDLKVYVTGNDSIVAGGGDDNLFTNNGADTILAGAGNDTVGIDLDSKQDVIDMGAGLDRFTLSSSSELNIVMSGNSATMTVKQGGVLAATIKNSESFYVYDGGGADVLLGGTGGDTIAAGQGADTIRSGAGDDSIVISTDSAKDIVDGGGGDSDLLTFSGNDAALTAQAISATSFSVVRNGTVIMQVTGIEIIDATGTGGNDTLIGLGGNDKLTGGAGADKLIGGAGIDTVDFFGETGGISVKLVTGKTVTATLGGKAEDQLTGIENLVGTYFADTLIGGSDDNIITDSVGTANQILDGGAGVDTLIVRSFDKAVTVDLGHDPSIRNFENVRGSYGPAGDTLVGNDKANRIESGGGLDMMTGGGLADTFAYTRLATYDLARHGDYDQNPAVITDFSVAQKDRIDLSTLATGYSEKPWTFLGSKAFTGAEAELRYSKGAHDTFVLADFDGDKLADFAIKLETSVTLTADQFIL